MPDADNHATRTTQYEIRNTHHPFAHGAINLVIHFDIFTLFPGMFDGLFADSILKRAQEAGVLSVALHNIRDYAEGRHRVTDDTPYGGGGGMVMKPEPICRAVETVLNQAPGWRFELVSEEPPAAQEPVLPLDVPIILLTPQGRTFTQKVAEELAGHKRIALICGRYEGVDERVRTHLVTDEISIGDFVISGGELAAAIVVDAVTRLQPGALGCEMGAFEDSFATGLLEYPQYTRPAAFRGEGVPEILASGDHAKVARWRREQALLRTWQRRPDLLNSAPLSAADRAFLTRLEAEAAAQASQAAGAGDQLDPPPA
jgi:tRNA (guanine37-N1)-methyltransferase